MTGLTNNLHELLFTFAEFAITLIEIWGLMIVGIAMIKEIYTILVKYKFDFSKINDDNNLNAGLASALEVLLAAEILKTLIVTDYRNLVIIAVLIVLRIAITLLLVWETEHKSKHGGSYEQLINKNEEE